MTSSPQPRKAPQPPPNADPSWQFATASHSGLAARPKSVLLEIVQGPSRGRVVEFSRHESFVVGRADSCQLRVEGDPHVSRFHLRLEVNPPAARVIDLDSSNGTWVNGQRIKVAELHEGDEVSAGGTMFRIRYGAKPQVAEQDATVDWPAGTPLSSRTAPVASSGDAVLGATAADPAFSLPRYEIRNELGRGPLGVVHWAIEQATGRSVAVKMFRLPRAVDPQTAKWLLDEAQVFQKLRHQLIVQVEEFGAWDGGFYAVMELVDRLPLDALWQGMPWERRTRVACGIACQTLEALAYAHARSVVHRDIKPENVLLVRSGRKLNVKVSDFAWASLFQQGGFAGLADDRTQRGRLDFLAPERVIDCRLADPAGDLYAVGVTLYKFLSGLSPFEDMSERSAFAAILDARPTPLDAVCPGVPAGLAALVHRALAKNPSDRFATAAEMREALLPFSTKG